MAAGFINVKARAKQRNPNTLLLQHFPHLAYLKKKVCVRFYSAAQPDPILLMPFRHGIPLMFTDISKIVTSESCQVCKGYLHAPIHKHTISLHALIHHLGVFHSPQLTT